MPDSCRTVTDKRRTSAGQRQGVRYRLAALKSVAGRDTPTSDAGQVPDSAGQRDRHTPDALTVQLQAENAFLRAALLSEQEAVKAAQANVHALAGELAKAREQSAVLVAKTAGAFTTFADPGERSNAPRIAPSDTHTNASGESVETPGSGNAPQKSQWWHFGRNKR